MINEDNISEIQKKIEESIYEQVVNGKQSDMLPNGYKACGQFFKINDRTQRGLHGTSSALKIIALSTSNMVKDSIPPIINYIKDHSSVELALLSQQAPSDSVRRDELNVIKNSECLYSLSYVQGGVGNKDQIVGILSENLKQGIIEKKGWGYFTGDNKIELLPTAFAAMAVFSNGFTEYENTYNFIFSEIEGKIKGENFDLTTYTVLIFALYVITFYYGPGINNKILTNKFKDLYFKLWKSDYRTFNEDIEQNIEYWNQDNHYYIRIPWQLYMLALTSKFSSWNFAKIDTQKRLNSIYRNCVDQEGFRYRYSGPYFSVRTHSIIYETLGRIRENLNKRTVYFIFYIIDHVRNILAHKITRMIISILSISLAWIIINRWYDQGTYNISDLAPELLGPILVWLILIAKKK